MKKLLLLVSFLVTLVTTSLYAQNVTLEECVQMAMRQHPDFQEQKLNLEMADANLSLAKSNRLPNMGFQVSQSTNTGRSIDRFTNSYINQVYNSTYAQANLSQPIFMGFGIKNDIQSKASQYESEKYTLEARRNNLTVLVIQAFLNVLQSEELSQTAQNQTLATKEQFDLSEKRFQAGTISKKELLQLHTQLAQNEFDEITASNQVQKARLALFQLLNVEPSEEYHLKKVDIQESVQTLEGSAIIFAPENFPELKASENTIKAIDYQTKSIRSQNLPSLYFYAGWNTLFASSNPEERFFQQLNATRNASFTLSLQIPILGRLQTNPKIQASKIQHKLAQNQLERNRLAVNQGYQSALLNFQLAKKQYANAEKQLQINHENMDMIEAEMAAGTNNVIDYILAKSNLDKALSTSIQSKYGLLLQNKIINFYQTGFWELD